MGHNEYHDTVTGRWMPSVTTILSGEPKPWLIAWQEKWGRRAEQKTVAATKVGTAFHTGVEGFLLGARVTAHTKRLFKMLERIIEWFQCENFISGGLEVHVASQLYGYAGTFDAIGAHGEDQRGSRALNIYDWKTSSGIYPDMALQLSAYAQAYFEQTGIRIKRGYIVHVSKKKPHHKLTVKEYSLNKRLFNKFLKRLKEFKGTCPLHNGACPPVEVAA